MERGIILGENASLTLKAIATSLDKKQSAAVVGQRATTRVSPWICSNAATVITASDLINLARLDKDELVKSDPVFLAALADFMASNPKLILDDLVGQPEDWRIHVDASDQRPQMLHELRCLVLRVRAASPTLRGVLASCARGIVPLMQERPRGLSTGVFRGAIFLGYPKRYDQLNLDLDFVHEVGHQALLLIASIDKLFESDPSALVYSEVRHAERPAYLSLHAAAAIAFMLKYLIDVDRTGHVHPDFTVTMNQALERAIVALRAKCRFTMIGESVIRDFEHLLER